MARFQSLYNNVFSLCRDEVLAGGRVAKRQVSSLKMEQVASFELGGSSSTRRKVPLQMGIKSANSIALMSTTSR